MHTSSLIVIGPWDDPWTVAKCLENNPGAPLLHRPHSSNLSSLPLLLPCQAFSQLCVSSPLLELLSHLDKHPPPLHLPAEGLQHGNPWVLSCGGKKGSLYSSEKWQCDSHLLLSSPANKAARGRSQSGLIISWNCIVKTLIRSCLRRWSDD